MYNKDIPKQREKQGKLHFYQLNQGVTQNGYNRKQNKKSIFANGFNE